MTDEHLMHRIQQGDREAMEGLVRRYHRVLLAYFYRLSTDYHLAQDLGQECLFRLMSRAGQYRYPEPLKPWLYRIAINMWRDHARSAAYRHSWAEVPLAEVADGGEALSGEGLEDSIANRLMADQALTAVRCLPPAYSEVLLLRFCEALTVPEIAAVLGIPEGTVKSRIFHGLRHLRTQLAEEVSEDGRSAHISR